MEYLGTCINYKRLKPHTRKVAVEYDIWSFGKQIEKGFPGSGKFEPEYCLHTAVSQTAELIQELIDYSLVYDK